MARDSFGPEVRSLARKLLLGYRLYFDRFGALNSDGRRLLAELCRYLVYEHPELKRVVRRVRKNPTLENLSKLFSTILGEDEVANLVGLGIYGPYNSPPEALQARYSSKREPSSKRGQSTLYP